MLRTSAHRAPTRIVPALGLALSLALLVVVADPEPVSAASYGGQCGSGYSKVNEAPISGGTIFLTYNSSSGKNCVVVVRDSTGAGMNMHAALKTSDGTSWQTDKGDFTQYAGPVYLPAAGTCVDWGGQIGNEWVVRTGTNCS
ncbi:spore-associated protein A [Nocardiopsis sp. YSL2]|uniref:spore-associated protein A n=1 Tax=Nocardiopsis sp. YSL2 TaxID=2939492 RepID=UPI0026F43D12|nr:spore-associated protein A [Nocardiopsis sp. YSL2]